VYLIGDLKCLGRIEFGNVSFVDVKFDVRIVDIGIHEEASIVVDVIVV